MLPSVSDRSYSSFTFGVMDIMTLRLSVQARLDGRMWLRSVPTDCTITSTIYSNSVGGYQEHHRPVAWAICTRRFLPRPTFPPRIDHAIRVSLS